MCDRSKKMLFFLLAFFMVCLSLTQPAIAEKEAEKQIPLNRFGVRSSNPYVVKRFVQDGRTIDKVIVPSRPKPPEELILKKAVAPEPNIQAGINTIPNVPALTWCFGCSATSAAMMFGHYDNVGYSNMYTGPVNGGIFPMTNAVWGSASINGETRALCPLSATRLGLDGRATKGHVDDYWVKYGSTSADPFIGDWTEHTHGDCTADYMGTNQSSVENTDGSTTFWFYSSGAPLYDYTACEPGSRDGCHGMRLFAESRGYTVEANFSQYIYGYGGNTLGFTFEDFKTEIDAGRPVMIQVEGHSMLGFGYNDEGSIIYIHDTWNYSDHTMTWGGEYAGMQHYAVAVIQLALPPSSPPPDNCPACPGGEVTLTGAIFESDTTCECTGTTITLLGVTVENNATVSFNASTSITVGSGTTFQSGSTSTLASPAVIFQAGATIETGAILNGGQ